MNLHDLYGVGSPEPTKRKDTPRHQERPSQRQEPLKKAIGQVRGEVFGAWVLHSLIGKGCKYVKNMDKASKGKLF